MLNSSHTQKENKNKFKTISATRDKLDKLAFHSGVTRWLSRTELEMREQETMQRQEPSRIIQRVEARHVHYIPLVLSSAVTEGHLLLQLLSVQELHLLQMGVKLGYHRQIYMHYVFYKIPKGYVVRKPNVITKTDEPPTTRKR